MNSLKVLLVSEYFPPKTFGGGEISAYLLAKHLAKKGVEVSVLTSRFKELPEYEVKDKIKIYRRLKTGENPNKLLDNVKRAITFYHSTKNELINICREQRFDLVHCMNTTSLVGAAKAKRKLKLPLIATINSYTNLCPKGNLFRDENRECRNKCNLKIYVPCIMKSTEIGKLKNSFYLRYNPLFIFLLYLNYIKRRNALKNFDYLTCISKYVKKMLIKNDFDSDKMKVIYNIVQPEAFSIGRKNKKIKIVYLGAYTKIKGPQILLKALKNLDNYSCEFYGKGPLKEELIDFVEEHYLNASINNEINRSQVGEKLKNADVVVFPSLWPEPMGRVVIEAMSAGKIVIGSNVGGVKDLIEHGKNGFLFRPGDVKSLSRLMEEIIKKRYPLGRIRKAASISSKKYEGSKIADDFIEVYKQVKRIIF